MYQVNYHVFHFLFLCGNSGPGPILVLGPDGSLDKRTSSSRGNSSLVEFWFSVVCSDDTLGDHSPLNVLRHCTWPAAFQKKWAVSDGSTSASNSGIQSFTPRRPSYTTLLRSVLMLRERVQVSLSLYVTELMLRRPLASKWLDGL